MKLVLSTHYVFPGCDDVLVVLGGFGHLQSPVDAAEMYDPKTKSWITLPVSYSGTETIQWNIV